MSEVAFVFRTIGRHFLLWELWEVRETMFLCHSTSPAAKIRQKSMDSKSLSNFFSAALKQVVNKKAQNTYN